MSDKTVQIDHRIAVLSAILLGMVIITIAWCAYQSTLWSGIQTFLLRDSNAAARQSSTLTIQQGQYVSIDAIMFMNYINAIHDNNTDLSQFYYERFRPELKTAVDAWLETDPLNNPNAPPHPFVMPEYGKKYAEEIKQFSDLSNSKLEEAQLANHTSDNYSMFALIYASVLFISAILDKFSSKRLRLIILILGIGMFSITTAILFTMPVAME
ncbi:MAG: hypothetical protein ACREAK_04990 [Nitrosarchaeum sp.]